MSRLTLLFIVATGFVSIVHNQESEPKPQAYSAVAMATGGGAGAQTVQFDFRITRFATDAEVQRWAQLAKEKGNDALRRELEKEDAGHINVVGSTGNEIAVARKRRDGPNTIITVVTARNIGFGELHHGTRSADYPFGFMQVKLNEKGEGVGKIMGAAKLKFDEKKGHYEIESYGNQYVQVANVRPQ